MATKGELLTWAHEHETECRKAIKLLEQSAGLPSKKLKQIGQSIKAHAWAEGAITADISEGRYRRTK